jgi:6-pyruvoyl-tetrahydropterin synthase
MFSVGVRDHVMVAHSFKGELFGPAQKLHGATYVVDVELRRKELHESGVVVDISRATQALRKVLDAINYKNLDEIEELLGKNTTTEFLAMWICEKMCEAARREELGPGCKGLSSIKATLHESHVAWASFEREL